MHCKLCTPFLNQIGATDELLDTALQHFAP